MNITYLKSLARSSYGVVEGDPVSEKYKVVTPAFA